MTRDGAPGRFQAPISYVDVRKPYNTFRALGGALLVIAALTAPLRDAAAVPWLAVVGALVAGDAVARRGRGTSALAPLLLDATVLAVSLLIRGHAPALEGPGFLYLLTGAMLLLPLRRAIGLVGYALAWAVPVALVSDGTVPLGGESVLDYVAVAVLVGLIVQLLYSAGRALYAAGERHREALESERRAVRLKDEFVSMVSHELRTPLTSIAGFTDTLRDTWAGLDPEEVKEFLVIMRRETEHLADLVEDILVIPRLEAGRLRLELEEIDLHGHAYETAQTVFGSGATEFSVVIPGGVRVEADPMRLRQVLRNLLENAGKYGGDQVLIEGEPRGPMYEISISDNGPGIPEEDRDRIFEHFEQASKGDARAQQGVGLGLPIARRLARAMGGDLWFEPRFPTGSIFCFTIPLAAAPAEEENPVTESAPAAG